MFSHNDEGGPWPLERKGTPFSINLAVCLDCIHPKSLLKPNPSQLNMLLFLLCHYAEEIVVHLQQGRARWLFTSLIEKCYLSKLPSPSSNMSSRVAVQWQTWKEIDLRGGKQYLLMQESMFCFFSGSWGEGVKFNKAILWRGSFDQRFSKQAACPTWKQRSICTNTSYLYILTSVLLKESCIGNRWTISFSAWGIVFPLRDVSWCVRNVFLDVHFIPWIRRPKVQISRKMFLVMVEYLCIV